MKRQGHQLYSRFRVVLLPLALLLCAVTLPLRADEQTRCVQEELRKRNMYFGDVDGTRSPQLIAALRRYQERKGFDPSGEADDQTLRSLSLLQPQPMSFSPPAAAAAIAISNQNPAPAATPSSSQDAPATSWPNGTILRSDQGRGAPPDSAMVLAITPGVTDAISPPARFNVPPPPSSTSNQHPTAAEVRDFIARYLRAGQTNMPGAEMGFYAERVNYFNEGSINHSQIAADIGRYEKRWPTRSFTLVGPVSVVADANNLDHTLAHFRYRFTNQNGCFIVRGEADDLFTLAGNGPGNLRIIAMRERRVR